MKGKGANKSLYKRQMIIEFHKAGMTFESGYFESIKDIVREEVEEEKGTVVMHISLVKSPGPVRIDRNVQIAWLIFIR